MEWVEVYNIPVTMAIFWKERTPVCALVTVIHEAAIGFRRHSAVFSWVSLYDASQPCAQLGIVHICLLYLIYSL